MILHLVQANEWESSPTDQPFVPADFAKDGFVHCTGDYETLLKVANQFYVARSGTFFVLVIDETKLASVVKWEAPIHPETDQRAPILPIELGDAHIAAHTDLPHAEHAREIVQSNISDSVATTTFPHIYGPINRDAITFIQTCRRAADGVFIGFERQPASPAQPIMAKVTDVQLPPPVSPESATSKKVQGDRPDPNNPLGLKRHSELANELLDATDGVSEALKRLKDRTEAHLAELDENIKKI